MATKKNSLITQGELEMLGSYRDRHIAMWQYVIDHVDEIFENLKSNFPEDALIVVKEKFIKSIGDEVFDGCSYACRQCENDCSACPIVNKAGWCLLKSSLFNKMLIALEFGHKKKFL